MPPHEPSASCRATTHSAAAAQRRRAAPGRSGGVRSACSTRSSRCERSRPGGAAGRPVAAARRCAARRARTPSGRTGRSAPTIGERHDRLPGPAGEVVDVEREPARQQHHLGRHRRQRRPTATAPNNASQIRVNTRLRLDAAVGQDELGGPAACAARPAGRRPAAARRRPRPWWTGRRARRGRWPRCRRRAAGTGSSAPAGSVCSGGADAEELAAAAGPRRPSSRWSPARPSTSPPGAAGPAGGRGRAPAPRSGPARRTGRRSVPRAGGRTVAAVGAG